MKRGENRTRKSVTLEHRFWEGGRKTNRYVYRTHNYSHIHGISSSTGAFFFFFTNCQVPSPIVSFRLPPVVSIRVVLGESFSKRSVHVCGQSSMPGITRALSPPVPLPGPVNYYGSYILAARDKCRDPLFPGGPVRFLVSRKFGVSNLNNFAHRLPPLSLLYSPPICRTRPRDARRRGSFSIRRRRCCCCFFFHAKKPIVRTKTKCHRGRGEIIIFPTVFRSKLKYAYAAHDLRRYSCRDVFSIKRAEKIHAQKFTMRIPFEK